MSPAALIFAGVALAMTCFLAGFFFAAMPLRRRLREADARFDTLKGDFEAVSAVNLHFLKGGAPAAAQREDDTVQRFLDLYDDAKRCLHRALDRHNALAPKPIVIARDGGNILQALADLPPLTFSTDARKETGLRSWLFRVLELEIERRKLRQAPAPDEVAALETELQVWSAMIKQRA